MSKYLVPTLKILFGRASCCAYPGCVKPLIFEDRGILTPTVQIAHIRSEKVKGPRHDPSYPKPKLNLDENLLLLCGEHHKPVDDNESVYPVDELLEWKSRQVAANTGKQFSGQQLQQIVEEVQRSLAELTEVRLSVQPVGMINVGQGLLAVVPLAGLAKTTLSVPENGRYLGVKVENEGQVPVTVDAVGIDFEIDGPSNPVYHFPLDDSGFFPSRRLEGKSSASWPAHVPTVQAAFLEVARTYRHVPSRFRPFVQPGSGDRVEGDWVSSLLLPFWKPDVTEERLQDFPTATTDQDAT